LFNGLQSSLWGSGEENKAAPAQDLFGSGLQAAGDTGTSKGCSCSFGEGGICRILFFLFSGIPVHPSENNIGQDGFNRKRKQESWRICASDRLYAREDALSGEDRS